MNNKKIPHWHQELQQAIIDIGLRYCLNSKDLLPFLTATLCGQFAISGRTEEFVKSTLDRIFEQYKEIKKRINNE